MIKKITLIYLFFGFFMCVGLKSYSQINFSQPAINFTQACASSGFNTFNFSFSFFPAPNLQPGNQFIVELSNSSGSFASPTVVKVLTNTTSPVSSNFNLPTNTYGEGYRIRVRSTAPVKVSSPSNAFAAYYAVHNQPFSINNNVGHVQICTGDSYTINVDNTGTPASPAFYPQLHYKWYKNFTEIPGETGTSITVNESGNYYAIVDYGSCVMNSYSNMVQIEVMSDLSPSITSQGGSPIICPGGTNTLTSSLTSASYTYKWFKDNVIIAGATAPTYAASESGVYHLEVSNGPCPFESDAITLDVVDYNLSINPSATASLIPGSNVVLSATENANAPTYKWYKDGAVIASATLPTYSATQPGIYKIEVTQTTPCPIVKEAQVTVAYPTGFDLAIQPTTAYTSCVSSSVTLGISQFNANTPQGTVNLVGNSYGYSYQWYKNTVPVASATNPNLTISSAAENGIYELRVTMPGYGTIASNSYNVNLNIGTVAITGDSTFCTASSVLLSATPNDPGYNYQWYKDSVLMTGETASTLSANAEGEYYVIMSGGICSTTSNVSVVSEAEITVTSTAPATDIIIPGQIKTINVTTDAATPAFAWYKDGTPTGGTTSTLTASEDGQYMVEVLQTVGCNATAQKTFVLEYPSAFILNTVNTPGYIACISTATTLDASSFTAVTTQGNVDVMSMGYAFQWYRNNTPVTGAVSTTLALNSASQNGDYKLGVTIPDVGIVYSNTITINLAVEPVTINNDTVLCEGSTVLFSSSINSAEYTYQWYKDNIAIAGAVASSFAADAEGSYYVIVTSGTCSSQSNSITLTIADISISSTSPTTGTILPGETKTITVSTDAMAPAYSWTRNFSAIGNTTSTLTATQDGVYTVTVTQTSGCPATAQKTFALVYPSSFNIAIDTATGYTACTSSSVNVVTASFTATTPDGIIDASMMVYPMQWYKNGVPVAGATSSALTVTNAQENGIYKLGITIPGYGTIFSNDITVNLAVEAVTINNNTVLCPGSDIVFNSDVTTSQYTYQWYKDNVAMAGETTPTLTVNAEGAYYLNVSSGTCTTQSNIINLVTAQIVINSASPATDVILPGETKTILVTTDAQTPDFSWTRDGSPISNTTASLETTQDGEYTVTVTQTAGCLLTAQKTFILQYPTGFNLTIAADAGYTPCTSTSATLDITSFTATTTNGNIDVTLMSYAYQWYNNGSAVTGANSATLTISDATQNGDYTLGVTVPGFPEVISNTITVTLSIGDVEITPSGSLCDGNPVSVSSNVTYTGYTYVWYKNGVAMTETGNSITTSETADYYLVVNTGSCSYTSNTVTISEADFNLTTANGTEEYLIPGESLLLSISTDASQPQIEWYRNGILIDGETTTSLNVTLDGEYKVVVTQTAGCVINKELTFSVAYPTDIELEIEAAGFAPCSSTTAALSVLSFTGSTPSGPVDFTGAGYDYQWFLNGEEVAGENEMVYEATQSGEYTLQVVIPQTGTVTSNTVSVHLSFLEGVVISADGLLCPEGGTVILTPDVNNPLYSYQWYNGANEVIGTETTITIGEAGSYYLVVTYAGCSVTSNTLDIEVVDLDQIIIDSETSFSILEGTTTTITAAGGESYVWFHNNVPVSTSATVTISQAGTYRLEATIGNCVITKLITVTTRVNDIIAIPNVITPNNDGINDKWAIPVKYSEDTTEIAIYAPDGKLVLKTTNYENNWPEDDFVYPLYNPVYYYTITENNEITKKGSITLVK